MLVVQIPCYNEEEHLPETMGSIPRVVSGIDEVLVLVISDGSTDSTVETALQCGADYVVRFSHNQGLAKAFTTGINVALALGADIIVNTDGDHQYPGEYIHDLVKPIIGHDADIVIGDRNPGESEHFSFLKKRLQVIGSWVVTRLSGIEVPDAASGFRAYSRYAATRLQVTNTFSYTTETIIQAGNDHMSVRSMPIKTNPEKRTSRLHKGILNFVLNQAGIILRSTTLYKPLQTFSILSLLSFTMGAGLIGRFLVKYIMGQSGIARNIQSVTIGGVLVILGVLLMLLGMLGDAINTNRILSLEILSRQKYAYTMKDIEQILGQDKMLIDNEEKKRSGVSF